MPHHSSPVLPRAPYQEFPLLGSKNYRQWCYTMKFLLNREEPQPQEATMRSLPSPKADKRKSKESCTVICQSCTPHSPRSYILRTRRTRWKCGSSSRNLYSRVKRRRSRNKERKQFQKYKLINEYGAKAKNLARICSPISRRGDVARMMIPVKQVKMTFRQALKVAHQAKASTQQPSTIQSPNFQHQHWQYRR